MFKNDVLKELFKNIDSRNEKDVAQDILRLHSIAVNGKIKPAWG
jgi:hypothetical protein